MTTLQTLTLIPGEAHYYLTLGEAPPATVAIVEAPANPHRFAVWASSLILAGTAAAAFVQVGGTDEGRGRVVAALFLALLIWLHCLARFNQRAEAGDR